MSYQANVTFTALSGDIFPEERILNLTPKRPTIKIGRASKSIVKGIMGAEDNAWFDSPVMSRDHAEITLDTEANVVTIQDMRSMHGTSVEQQRLEPGEPFCIADGSIVKFGTQVKRGNESFPPCHFRVNYEIIPWKSSKSNAYTVPDTSDEEDEEEEEEDYEFSDEEIQEGPSSEDDLSLDVEVYPVNEKHASSAIEPIDLTGDDTPSMSPRETMQQALSILSTGVAAVQTFEAAQHQSSSGGNQSSELFQTVDSDSEEEAVELIAEVEEVARFAPDLGEPMSEDSSSGSESGNDEVEYNGSESDVELELDSANSESESVDLHMRIEQSEDIMNAYDSNENEEDSDEQMSEQASEHDIDQDSDLGLSECGAEGLQELFEEDLLGVAEESPYFEARAENKSKADAVNDERPVYSDPDPDEVIKNYRGAVQEVETGIHPASTTRFSNSHLWFTNEVNRLPSPSDAAMVKTGPNISVPLDTSPAPDSSNTIKSLGDKTGKHAFFEAREENKATFQAPEVDQTEVPRPLPNIEPSPAAEVEAAQRPFRRSGSYSRPSIQERKRFPRTSRIFSSSFHNGFENYIHPPSVVEDFDLTIPSIFSSHRASTPTRGCNFEPDMTSAATYNQSKAAMSTASNKLATEQPARSRLSISDIIEGSSNDSSKSLKRKAEDISDVVGNEVRIWAANSSVSDKPQNTEENPILASISSSPSEGEVTCVPVSAPSAPEARPAKRFKKFVEAVTYAALGGAAVGAGLFSVLVATAPDFM